MSALTTAPNVTNMATVFSMPSSFRVANAVRIWSGALCGLPGTNALTSARGYLSLWQDQINLQWAGIAIASSWTKSLITSAQTGTAANLNSVLGDTSASPVPEISVEMGPVIWRNLTVTGVSAQADLWRTLIYCSTDNYTDLSTSATNYAPAIGKVIYWNSSTTASVLFFGALRMTNIS